MQSVDRSCAGMMKLVNLGIMFSTDIMGQRACVCAVLFYVPCSVQWGEVFVADGRDCHSAAPEFSSFLK